MNEYPLEILPQKNYKHITCDLSHHHLIRHTKNQENLINVETDKIFVENICSPREHVEDLSTSLLGVYDFTHIPIQLTDNGKSIYAIYWQLNVEINPIPKHNTDFILNNDRGYWTVLIGDIQDKVAEFTRGNNEKFNAICKVIHTPMNWNFWHFSIRWYLPHLGMYLYDIQDVNEQNKIKKKLGNEARALIAQFATIKEPNYSNLPKEEYNN